MKPKHVVEEIIADYRRNIMLGMTERQARLTMLDMLVDYIEAQNERHYTIGEKAGRFGAMTDARFGHVASYDMGGKVQLGFFDHTSDQPETRE